MDLTVIPTFRCNSRCQMCYIWKNPTEPKLEVTAETLAKLPAGFDNLNLSGGEPTTRRDLGDAGGHPLSEGAHHGDQLQRPASRKARSHHQEISEHQGAFQPRGQRNHQQSNTRRR